jgi:1-acyl-sn-glycerol-3-phosphate acyltransferase
VRGFSRYSRRYVRKHFHSVLLSSAGGVPQAGRIPVVAYLNHASWWDPLICLELHNRFLSGRTGFAPIEAAALQQYPFFKRLGFFPVEAGSRRGALSFVRTAQEILGLRMAALWITPQGQFADARQRPAGFQSGLGHLAAHAERALFMPVAIEYVFWQERLPQVLVRFGEPVEFSSEHPLHGHARDCSELLERKLVAAQDALALESQLRDPSHFEQLLRGRSGVGFSYDAWRRLRAAWRGETFRPQHGDA